jgi:hypothetical protein
MFIGIDTETTITLITISERSMAGERARMQHQAGEIRIDVAELEEWNHSKPNSKSTAIPSTSTRLSKRPLPTRTELLYLALRNADHPCIRGRSDFFGVDLTTLQRLNLYNLQHELVQCATKMTSAEGDADTAFSSAAMADLHALLHRYSEFFFFSCYLFSQLTYTFVTMTFSLLAVTENTVSHS